MRRHATRAPRGNVFCSADDRADHGVDRIEIRRDERADGFVIDVPFGRGRGPSIKRDPRYLDLRDDLADLLIA